MVLVALGPDAGSTVLKHFPPGELEAVTAAIAALGPVDPHVTESVLDEFLTRSRGEPEVLPGDLDAIRRVITQSHGAASASRILDRVTRTASAGASLEVLERAEPVQLASLLVGEHPQLVAAVLAWLPAGRAADVIPHLPDTMRFDVLSRMATLEEIPPALLSRIGEVIARKLHASGSRRNRRGGVEMVAAVCNQLGRATSQSALEAMSRSAPDLATDIRSLMFVFDDIVRLDDAALRQLIARVDKTVLTMALKGTGDAVRTRVFANMSVRAGGLMKEELEALGKVRVRRGREGPAGGRGRGAPARGRGGAVDGARVRGGCGGDVGARLRRRRGHGVRRLRRGGSGASSTGLQRTALRTEYRCRELRAARLHDT